MFNAQLNSQFDRAHVHSIRTLPGYKLSVYRLPLACYRLVVNYSVVGSWGEDMMVLPEASMASMAQSSGFASHSADSDDVKSS